MNTTTRHTNPRPRPEPNPESGPAGYGTPAEAIRFLGATLAVVVLVPILLTLSAAIA